METEVVIIGAGPIGIEMAIALKERGIPYLHFDKGQAGQMILNFPPCTRFFSSSERIALAGIPIHTTDQQKCSREQYLAYLRSVIMHFGLDIRTYEEVFSVTNESEGFLIRSRSARGEHTCRCRYLILATGGTAYPRMLGVPGEELPHVSIKLLDPHRYFQKKVVVVGGKNSAAETALRCFHAGAKVSMVVRRAELTADQVKYWILPELQGYFNSNLINGYFNSAVTVINPCSVEIINSSNQQRTEIDADFVIKAIGFECDMELCRQVGVLVDKKKQPQHDALSMETNISNVYTIGTAIGGTQTKFTIFIENCHEHVNRVMQSLSAKMKIPYHPPLFMNKGKILQTAFKRPEE